MFHLPPQALDQTNAFFLCEDSAVPLSSVPSCVGLLHNFSNDVSSLLNQSQELSNPLCCFSFNPSFHLTAPLPGKLLSTCVYWLLHLRVSHQPMCASVVQRCWSHQKKPNMSVMRADRSAFVSVWHIVLYWTPFPRPGLHCHLPSFLVLFSILH